LRQCANGNRVEKVEGNQIDLATFTLLPIEGTRNFW
jgi:hypothetical protein